MTTALQMKHDTDPKADLLKKVGNIDELEVFHSDLLIAIYIQPEKTKGGLFLPDSTRGESVHQGKVGLVLKKGPAAFKDDSRVGFYGVDVNVGDWVYFWPSDGRRLTIGSADCRMLSDVHVRGRVPAPDYVW